MAVFGYGDVRVVGCFILVTRVLVWALELVGVAVVMVGSLKVDGMSQLCWAVAGCVIGLWLTTVVCKLAVTSVTLEAA